MRKASTFASKTQRKESRSTEIITTRKPEDLIKQRQVPLHPQDPHEHDLQEHYQQRLDNLEQDLKRRQESYIRRERQYKARIEELEKSLTDAREERKDSDFRTSEKMEGIRNVHKSIISSVEQVQERTAKVLQEQEKDLLRAFRARLFDVQTELEKEKNKTDDGACAWIEKSKQLEAEVDWAKEMADRLDRLNQSLTRENLRLKNQFTSQENDREFLVQQLVAVKKDNARLRAEFDNLKKEMDNVHDAEVTAALSNNRGLSSSTAALPRPDTGSKSGNSRPNTAAGAMNASSAEADNRYKEVIKRLKRLLEVERRNLRQVRAAYTNDLQSRTELEVFLKQCIDDVRTQIANRKANRDPTTKFDRKAAPATTDLKKFSSEDRERVMELLLSQERVINLLYAKTFPSSKEKTDALSGSGDPMHSTTATT